MMIEVLKSKLHCVQVTEANLHYMGSITIDEDLMDAAGMIAGEKVQIVDNNNGERFETPVLLCFLYLLPDLLPRSIQHLFSALNQT